MARKTMVKIPALAAALGLLWTGSALAQEGGGAAGPQGSGQPEKSAKRICRTITPTGSRFTTRRCMTQADWDRNQERTADGVLKTQTDNQTLYEQQARPQ